MSTLVVFLALLLAWRLRRWILLFRVLALLAGCGHAPVEAPRIELQARTYTPWQLTCLPDPPVPGRPPAPRPRFPGRMRHPTKNPRTSRGS